MPNRKLKINLHKVARSWWWEEGENVNLSHFTSTSYKSNIFSKVITTNSSGKASIKINAPNLYGKYLLVAEDQTTQHKSSTFITFSNWGDESSSAKKVLDILSVSSDKKNYFVGDTAYISFPSSSNQTALISIEKGGEVVKSYWVHCNEKKTVEKVSIEEYMMPNFFVSIMLFQPYGNTKNDLPLRLYSIINLKVEKSERHLYPTISTPEIISPSKSFRVVVSEKNKKNMTYTLAIVDEGLLSLTNHKLKDPYDVFNVSEAYRVSTYDLYKNIFGAYKGNSQAIAGIGGGVDGIHDENNVMGGKKVSRFKPVVKFLGPYNYNGEARVHNVKLDNYIGSVKFMVVAGNVQQGNYGVAQKKVPVKNKLMVFGTFPRKLTPGEKINIPVTVFKTEESVQSATVKVETNDKLNPLGVKTKNIDLSKKDEKVLYFEYEALNKTGAGKILFTATNKTMFQNMK